MGKLHLCVPGESPPDSAYCNAAEKRCHNFVCASKQCPHRTTCVLGKLCAEGRVIDVMYCPICGFVDVSFACIIDVDADVTEEDVMHFAQRGFGCPYAEPATIVHPTCPDTGVVLLPEAGAQFSGMEGDIDFVCTRLGLD